MVSAVLLPRSMNLFSAPADRAKAMGIDMLLGGPLTSALSWHWIFLINLPIGVAVLASVWVGILVCTRVHRRAQHRSKFLHAVKAVIDRSTDRTVIFDRASAWLGRCAFYSPSFLAFPQHACGRWIACTPKAWTSRAVCPPSRS